MLKREDILHQEKLSLQLYMKYRKFLSITESAGKIKNANDAEENRKLGNELYRSRHHNSTTHKEIWHYYSQSIALAPNNSEDLALGYGNRSALFFHIKKYKECITDIDKALSITSNNLFKVKLLCRKAESLMMLNESTKLVCEEALQILEQLQESEKKVYSAKLNQLFVSKNTIKSDIKLHDKGSGFKDLLNFEHSKEIPSVSKSVAIKYDKKWGRHVVATKDIKPGEIISVQKCCFTYIADDLKYLYCSYCTIIAYNSLPCEFCIHSIYCSEACRSKAWIEYHQYECVIYQHTPILTEDILYMRFVLSAIYEVGSIEQMKEHILEIENTKDSRIKGFSNGIFYTEQKKNLYSFKKCDEEILHYNKRNNLIANICNLVYLLAKFTNFFGQNTNVSEPELLLNEDRLFIAALILRTSYIMHTNFEPFSLKLRKSSVVYDFYIDLFNNFINYNCHSNVRTVRTNGGINIMFACHPIKKGSQLFKNYKRMHFLVPKKVRQNVFRTYQVNFTCECIACIEDWSPISVPSIEQLFEITPSLDALIVQMNRILLIQVHPEHRFSRFTPKLLNEVFHHLAQLAEKFTVVCHDYFIFLQFIEDLIYQVFSGYFFEMPAQCE